MQKRPQTSHPGGRTSGVPEARPQTHHLTKRALGTKSSQQLPSLATKEKKSILLNGPPQPQIRMAIPSEKKYEVSNKHWDIASKQAEWNKSGYYPELGLLGKSRRPMTAYPQSNWIPQEAAQLKFEKDTMTLTQSKGDPLKEFEEQLKEEAAKKALAGRIPQPQQFRFLSKLGGNKIPTSAIMKPSEIALKEEAFQKAQAAGDLALPALSTLPLPQSPGILNAEIEIEPEKKQTITLFNIDHFAKNPYPGKTVRLASAKSRQPQTQHRMTGGDSGYRPVSSYVRKEDRKGESRPITAVKPSGSRPFSAFPNLSKVKEERGVKEDFGDYEELGIEEIPDNPETSKEYKFFEKVQEETYGRFYHKRADDMMKSRPTTANLQRKEEEATVYPDLFDRSERTKGATFAKYGDLSYSTPIQRVGRYMDFSANLKKHHLIDILSYLKTSSGHIMMPGEKRTPEEYLEQCLFSGLMKEETRKPLTLIATTNYEEETFSPQSLLDYPELLEYHRPWNPALQKEVEKSQKRYSFYIDKDEIRMDEIAVYNKKWMIAALEKLGDESLLRVSEDQMRIIYQDIIASYIKSMKRAIMNYILRCPLERKRLQITAIPRTILSSNEMIVYKGGFSIEKNCEWHRARNEALQDVKLKLLTNNIVMSALQNWFEDFRGFYLLYFKNLTNEQGYTIGVESFFDLEREYRRKVKGVFQHIWHRGAIMILYQFKYLKRAHGHCGRFTLQRYASSRPSDCLNENLDYAYLDNITDFSQLDEDISEEYSPQALIEDMIDIVQKEDLQDVRESQAYINYVKFLKGTINYNDDGYKTLSKEYRTELKYCAGNLMCSQMRMVIERTIDLIFKYFKRFEYEKVIKLDLSPMKRIRKLRKNFSGIITDVKRPRGGKTIQKQLDQPNGLDEMLAQICSNKIITKPIWRIEMEVRDGVVEMRESKSRIIEIMNNLIDRVTKTFNKFIRPEFARIEYIERKQLEYEDKEQRKKERVFMQLHNESGMEDNIIKLKAQRMYRKYCANIRITESDKEEKVLDQDAEIQIFLQQVLQKKCNIGNFMYFDQENSSSKYFDCRNYVQKLISTFYDEAYQLLNIFDSFKEVSSGEILEDCRSFTEKDVVVLDEYEAYVSELNYILSELDKIPKVFFLTMFEVGCEDVLIHLRETVRSAKDILQTRMESKYIEQCQIISQNYKKAKETILRDMKSPEDVHYIESFKSSLIMDVINWKESSYLAHKILYRLIDIDLLPTDSVMIITKKLHFWPDKIRNLLEEVEEKHKFQRQEQEKLLSRKREFFETEADLCPDDINEVEKFGEIKDYKNSLEKILQIEAKLITLDEQRELINQHEMLLYDFSSAFEKFIKCKNLFTPHCELWKSIDKFYSQKINWYSTGVSTLNSSDMEGQIKQYIRVLQNSQKKLDKKNHLYGYLVTEQFKKEVDDLQKMIPTVEILSNPGLKKRHWEEIQEMLHTSFDCESVSLKEIIAKGAEQFKEQLAEISDLASKEFKLEKTLQKMKTEWAKQEFVIVTKKDSDIKLLSGSRLEEMQIILDEDIITSQQIRANPFVKPMEQEAIDWEKKLVCLRDIIENWIKVQMNYLYLYPIFDSEDITKRLASEAKKFNEVDRLWKELMDRVDKDKQVLNVDQIPDLIESLENATKDLDSITVNLNSYLEDKRKSFPRFYFLANNDLYDILGDTRNPKKVNSYLKKIFEGVNSLIFSEKGEIIGLESPEGEILNFTHNLNPLDYHGNVESMLLDIESEMKDAVGMETEKSIANYSTNPDRINWVTNSWPAQTVLCVSQIFWCKRITECIASPNRKEELNEYLSKCVKQLEDVVTLVRGKLSKLQQIMLGSLIVLDVHANDVLESLIHNNITGETDFEWLCVLRYYFNAVSRDVEVRMIMTNILYGNEYLGNTSRLVITPLTDRCYRTMMSALKINLGGAPEGPAGTGKTETVKDLSKAMAVKILVFNCSEGLDYRSMAKLFKGLASVGAWSCFDEFNRIEPEVLSVVAQQILAIQTAKTKELTLFEFDGALIPLKQSCNVFITMNPGYVGRAELPDNLKALFRPAAMMVPDYAMIAEIRLYSMGFLYARAMAKKIVATYKLCSEQLSSQSHYDYGMRAVIAVLTAAGLLKSSNPDEKEEALTLKAIYDVNIPKFVSQDIQLFKWIISDLFPESNLPSEEDQNKVFLESVNHSLEKMKLQPVDKFVEKVNQLYDTINTRHGVMIVGDTLTAKSTSYKVLAESINWLASKKKEEESFPINEINVTYNVINPKSVPLDQLYGSLDKISQEWNEGVLAKTFRDCASHNSQPLMRKWIVLDGPVDTLWIESMNTVLDDNKMLCLMNGDIISMPEKMSMLFEVNDLSKASLATVSRCGMIYMPQDTISWYSILQSWIKELTSQYSKDLMKRVEMLFDGLISQSYEFITKRCVLFTKFSETHLAINLMKIFEGVLKDSDFLKKCNDVKTRQEDLNGILDTYFLYSLTWAICCNTNEPGNKKFSEYLRNISSSNINLERIKDKPFRIEKSAYLPESSQSLHSYFLDNNKWKLWREELDQIDKEDKPIEDNVKFHEIVIPTTDTLKYNYLINFMVNHNLPILIIGTTGTGKTLYVNSYMKSLSQDKFVTSFMGFSAQTSVSQTQDILETKLEPRKRGVFAPRYPKKLLVFVDDLNMPMVEKCGAQPPIELLRQFIDLGGWYSKEKDRKLKKIEDTLLIAAMGPAGGGRNEVTNRFLRHFNIISFASFDDTTLQRIFGNLMEWHVKVQKYPKELTKMLSGIVAATIDVYNFVSEKLLTTPEKFHYLFNMRDIARVCQGIQMATLKGINNKKLLRLFVHEISRVFFDRLITEQDKQLLYLFLFKTVREQIRDDLKMAIQEVIPTNTSIDINTNHDTLKYIIYADVMSEGISTYERTYDEVLKSKALAEKINFFMEEFNSTSRKPMNLVMFDYAIEHLLKICRILRMSKGNALLVGLGGSGKQSLTKLATFMCEFQLFEIEISKNYNRESWREDMKKMLASSGAEDKSQVFVLSDSQIKFDFLLEDVNNLLNTGEIPNLWAHDEKLEITEKIRNVAKKDGRLALYNTNSVEKLYDFFIEKVNFNLHIVMTMSPIGGGLRNKMRMFPSLVNCCTIDWFGRWPESGLNAVAEKYLKETEVTEPELSHLVNLCTEMHINAQSLSEIYLRDDKKYNYVTPTTFIELIQSYKSLLKKQREVIMKTKLGYSKGIEKLEFATKEVEIKQKELQEKEPFLHEMNEKTAELITKVNTQITDVVEPKKKVAMEEEMMATQQAQEAEKLLAECTQELAKFTPKLKEAQEKMGALTSKEINELKTYHEPPKPVKVVMEAVVVLREAPIVFSPNPDNPKEQIPNMWASAKKLLTRSDFLSGFNTMDYNNIKLEVIDKIRKKYMHNLQPSKLKDVSTPAYVMCLWLRAVEEYDKAYRIVRPKEIKAKEAKESYKVKCEHLKRIQDELQYVMNQLEEMQKDLDEKQKRKTELEAEIEDCKTKIVRARTLLEGLGGEKIRWSEAIENLQTAYENVTGDMIIASGIIAYLGAYPAKYRSATSKKWIDRCIALGVKANSNFTIEKSLGEAVVIHQWVMNGLPTDSFSKENAVIAMQSLRWPLMIDPESQANRWIKNLYQSKSLNIIKLSEDYIRIFKKAVPFGEPILLENIGTEIDSALDSILMKQTFKQGGVISIKLGDGIIDYSSEFQLFITTKLRSPHFLPELSTKLTLINFALTFDGLKDQLLDIVVQKERQELDEKRTRLIKQNYEYKRELKKREDNILEVLRSTQGNILDNEEAVNALKESQTAAQQVKEKQLIALETEKDIEMVRDEYIPISQHVASLYFIVSNLGSVNDMYQYSLSWYMNLFTQSIDLSERSEFLEQRIESLKEHSTHLLYENVIQSLFEKDKLLFSLLLAISIQDSQNFISLPSYHFFISEQSSQDNPLNLKNPVKSWLPDNIWNNACLLAKMCSHIFSELPEKITNNSEEWKNFYQKFSSSSGVSGSIPSDYNSIKGFDKLNLIKVFSKDKLCASVKEYIQSTIGNKFLYYPPFNLEKSYKNSNISTPIIFVLPGTDPMATLRNFAVSKGKIETMKAISLGQDQGKIALAYIEEAKRSGNWVILQNCHLAPSFMPTLEKVCDSFQITSSKDAIHPSFRLWLTSYSTDFFPVLVLQNGIKLTNEPPKGTKANMLGSFLMDPISDSKFFEESTPTFKRAVLALCFFHSIIQERRAFGPLGWNIPYDYNQSDLYISVRQLGLLMRDASPETAPRYFKSVVYLVGECNYGGRVTDDKDRRLLKAMLKDYFSNSLVNPKFLPSDLPEFQFPPANFTYDQYCAFIQNELPDDQPAELFGLHENAVITKNLKESSELIFSIQKIGDSQFQNKKSRKLTEGEGQEFKSSFLAEKKEDTVFLEILNKLPDQFVDLELAEKKYPPLYENSMNTVLTQELTKFDLLLRTIRGSLNKIIGALKGEVLLSSELEEVLNAIQIGKIPELWKAKSYPTQKPLGSYINDLKIRLMFFKEWVEYEPPIVYWLSGFFFTQSFLTGASQNYAREHKLEIDRLQFEFEFFYEDTTDYSVEILLNKNCKLKSSKEGVYISGLYLEGGKWDYKDKVLVESDPKILFTKAPIIWIKPNKVPEIAKEEKEYSCPVYKTTERRGQLQSTGHSSDFVMDIKLPIKGNADHWIKRGVAMICQLNN